MQSNIMLLITAAIWGSAFVAQKSGMDYIGPLTYGGIRTFIGGLALIPVIALLNKSKKETAVTAEAKAAEKKLLLIGGICCGIALFVASTLQQYGVMYTTAGKAGFITTLYVVMVPIVSIVIGKKIRPLMWICVGMGAVGLYLLCMTDASFSLSKGDTLVLLCALGFTAHILIIDYFAPKVDGVKLSCIQFLIAGLLGMIGMFIFEEPKMDAILQCWLPILYAGVLSSGVGYTLQIVAQKHAEPTVASLLMSLESVFAVIAGAIILHETMSGRELFGCAVIFAAVILAQLPSKEERLGNK
ncbi:MAG: DMT family transporter [Firmicutes bacterium]|nr:DMT family transporter [Bacillota bacterium]